MLAIENLDVFYGDAQALDGVSLTVEQGGIVAIVGANGAGKTSLIRAIAGMVRISVVFPAPLAPTMATMAPCATSSETPSSACASP